MQQYVGPLAGLNDKVSFGHLSGEELVRNSLRFRMPLVEMNPLGWGILETPILLSDDPSRNQVHPRRSRPVTADQCHTVPGQPAAMEVPGSGALNREYGGVVRVIATATRRYNLATLWNELGFFVSYDGNWFYSEHLTQSGRRPPQPLVGFSSSSQMNPRAVSQFLRKQTFVSPSVRLTKKRTGCHRTPVPPRSEEGDNRISDSIARQTEASVDLS